MPWPRSLRVQDHATLAQQSATAAAAGGLQPRRTTWPWRDGVPQRPLQAPRQPGAVIPSTVDRRRADRRVGTPMASARRVASTWGPAALGWSSSRRRRACTRRVRGRGGGPPRRERAPPASRGQRRAGIARVQGLDRGRRCAGVVGSPARGEHGHQAWRLGTGRLPAGGFSTS